MTPDYPVRTARLVLRPFTAADEAALHSWESRPDVVRYLYGEARTPDESKVNLARKMSVPWPEKEGQDLCLVIERDGVAVGEAVLKYLSEEHRQGEIGYIVHPDHHGHGYATEAAAAMLELGFGLLKLHRIVASCDARNDASWGVMERLGMRREAHFKHSELFKGEWGEEFVYAILEDEWRTSPLAANGIRV
ncbi:GNAT family N-acetyltransferase [Saccharothrix violaceirubra]|uniref:RimJ/RimL family protein N-acetyltransferase n=1 Tax=Saccharothrix violaceirubra TaxID=413306 RepID=A0A7W7T1I1_9PSEU|nr:GNAT family N-acetyltransferase [Saccharothrix violaceirubra]MBB4964821.1 RimJ/RimL family protein N-acetyltransferase [Saccharothrix violaceirubra]